MEVILVLGGALLFVVINSIVRDAKRGVPKIFRPTARQRLGAPPRPAPYRPQRSPKPGPEIIPDEPITGTAFVIDGDTIIINRVRIRLFGIDAPEMDHPYGEKSKWAMVRLCKGQKITAMPDGSLSHDRCVARCYLPDGRDLSAELVKQGLAIDWPKFSGGEYAALEPPGVRKKLWRAHNRQIGKYVPPARPRV